ncbi:hypothetical protein J6X90_03750 [Candidatus Saccharibacteria bacterium]|nr:hypothetical protein [Candidatus Saccharibacteria bacterium]
MRFKVKIAITSFFILILSVLNLKNGLIFKTTDNTERDAIFSSFEEKHDTINHKSVNLAGVNTAALPKHYDFTGARYTIMSTGNCPSRDPNTGKCILATPNSGIAQWRYTTSSKPFLYGHNYSTLGTIAYMRAGDTFSVRVDGVVRTYQVVKNFTLDNATANANRIAIYTSTYGGNYDITLQTCVGSSNAIVRYIQAVLV